MESAYYLSQTVSNHGKLVSSIEIQPPLILVGTPLHNAPGVGASVAQSLAAAFLDSPGTNRFD
jgi:hypothetical protein